VRVRAIIAYIIRHVKVAKHGRKTAGLSDAFALIQGRTRLILN
jgi:hypothetical protein